jgi:hypothetical protein
LGDPTLRIVRVSYAIDLAAKLANDCRAVMRSPRYRRVLVAAPAALSPKLETITCVRFSWLVPWRFIDSITRFYRNETRT